MLMVFTDVMGQPLKMGLMGCPEALVTNYQSALHDIPEEQRPALHGSGSLESCVVTF
jgi:hypothetical protein